MKPLAVLIAATTFVLSFLLVATGVLAGEPAGVYLLEAPQDVPFNIWRSGLEAKGIRLAHAYPPAGGLVIVDEDYRPELLSLEESPGTRIYSESPYGIDEERIRATTEGNILWNAHRKLLGLDEACAQIDLPKGQPLIDDAFAPPPIDEEFLGSCSSTSLKYSGTEYLLGNVSVNVILPESNGAIDTQTENWNSTRETSVTSEITEGLNDLRTLYGATLPAAIKPSFTYHYYLGRTNALAQTSYEPITRSAAPVFNDCTTGEGLWACEILNKLGYSAFTGYAKAREFNGDTRISDGTDWAFTIFVVDSENDADGKFADGRFGYAWLGGPWVMMTYDNDGWGITRLNYVTRHESCHINYALDEYTSSGCVCTTLPGYVNYQDQNCKNACSSSVTCVMDDNAAAICYYTKGQIGWGDLDSDNIPDPVDILPETTLTAYSPDPTTNTTLTFNGTSTIQKNTNNNVYNYKCDMNILTIANVQYRVDGGSWFSATPSDGSFNSGSENYTMTIGPLSGGTHTIDTRAVDELGQTDGTVASDTVTINVSGPPGVQNGVSGTAMTATPLDPIATLISINWDNSCAAANYSLVGGPGSGLPTSYGGPYLTNPALGICTIGTGSNFVWGGVPDPLAIDPATRFIWWLVVATDAGQAVEGAWGKNSGGLERNGLGVNGSSGQCAVVNKDLSNACGQ